MYFFLFLSAVFFLNDAREHHIFLFTGKGVFPEANLANFPLKMRVLFKLFLIDVIAGTGIPDH